MVKPLFYSALFASGLLVGAIAGQQSWTHSASAAGGATAYECVGFDSDDNGRATVSVLNMNSKSTGGTIKWYDENGDQVDDDVDFDIGKRATVRESTSKKGVVHAQVKADDPVLVDGRLQNDKGTVSVKCSPRAE